MTNDKDKSQPKDKVANEESSKTRNLSVSKEKVLKADKDVERLKAKEFKDIKDNFDKLNTDIVADKSTTHLVNEPLEQSNQLAVTNENTALENDSLIAENVTENILNTSEEKFSLKGDLPAEQVDSTEPAIDTINPPKFHRIGKGGAVTTPQGATFNLTNGVEKGFVLNHNPSVLGVDGLTTSNISQVPPNPQIGESVTTAHSHQVTPSIGSKLQSGQVPNAIPNQVPTLALGQVPTAIPNQVPTLAPGQIPTAIPNQVPTLAPGQVLTAIPNQVPTLAPGQIPTAIPNQVPMLTPGQVPNAIPNQVPTLTPGQVPSAIPNQVPMLTPGQVPNAIPNQVPTLAPGQVPNAIPNQVPTLTPGQVPNAIPNQVPTLAPGQVPTAIPNQVPMLTPGQVPTAIPNQVPTLAPGQVPNAIPNQVPTLTPGQVPTAIPNQVPTLTPGQVPTAIPNQVPTLTPGQVPTAIPNQVPTLAPNQVPNAIPNQVPTLTPGQVPNAIPNQVPTLTPGQVPNAIPNQVPMLTPGQVPTAIYNQVPTLAPGQVPNPIPNQVPTLTPGQVPNAIPNQMPTLTPGQVPNAIPNQVPTLAPGQVPNAIPNQVPTLTPGQVPNAIPNQVPTLTPGQVPTAIPNQVPTLTPGQIPTAIPNQVPMSASISVNAITPDNIINAIESKTNITVTGDVCGNVTDGDLVTLEINGHNFNGMVLSGKFSILVPGSDLAVDTNVHAILVATNSLGHNMTKTDDHSYIVDTNVSATDDSSTAIEGQSKAATSGNVLTNDDHDCTKVITTDVTGSYGTYHFKVDGSYTYQLDNTSSQALTAGQVEHDYATYEITDAAGNKTSATLTTTITGTNDNAVITGQDISSVTEDVNATAVNTLKGLTPIYQGIATHGQLTISDPDAGEAHFVGQQTAQPHGTFILSEKGYWNYTVDNSSNAVQSLGAGQSITDTIIVTSADGATHDIVVTIHGSNDTPHCTSEVQLRSGTEDTTINLTAAQLLANSSDIDANDLGQLHIDSITANHGVVNQNSDGSFTFTPDKDYNGAVHFSYDVKDAHGGMTHTGATTNLQAINDNPDVKPITDSLTEDTDQKHQVNLLGNATDVDGDPLSISQIQITFEGKTGPLPKGVSFASDGHTLVVDSHNPTFQHLSAGQKADIVVNYMVDDNHGGQTAAVATITMIGSDDKAQLQSSTIDMTESEALHTYYQMGSKVGGTLNLVDPDTNDHTQFAFSGDQGTQGYGALTIWPDGHYEYDLDMTRNHHANDKVAALKAGETLTDQYQIKTSDGQTKIVTVTIHGEDHDARIEVSMPQALSANQNVTEEHFVPASPTHLYSGGMLNVIDPDHGDAYLKPEIVTTAHHGEFRIRADGGWSYKIDNALDTVQHLGAGESFTESHTVHSKDGTASQVLSVTVHGTNDAPIVSAKVQLVAGTEDTDMQLSTVELLANATDIDHNDIGQLSIANLVSDHGVIIDNKDGSFRFIPEKDYNGEVLFSYDIKDAHGGVTQTVATTLLAGVQDNAVISGQDDGNVKEDVNVGPVVAGNANMIEAHGQMHISDPDAGENHFDFKNYAFIHDAGHPDFHPIVSALGGYLSIGSDGFWNYRIDTRKAVVQNLGAGETAIDKVVVHSIDGTAHEIQITIHGTNDAPYCSSEVQLAAGSEDTVINLSSAQLLANASDIDINDLGQLSIANLAADHGCIVDNHDGTFIFTPAKDYNGQVHFTYDVKDAHGGVTHTGATTSLTAAQDNAVITGQDSGSVTEDRNVSPVVSWFGNMIETQGQLHITDADSGENHFEFRSFIKDAMHPQWAPYSSDLGGHLSIGPNGLWEYKIDTSKTVVQNLGAGETAIDKVVVHSIDGTEHEIQVTIHGTNDAPYCSSAVQLSSGIEDTVINLTSAELLANASDIDANDLGQLSIANLTADHGTVVDNKDGSFSFSFTPGKDYNGDVHFSYDVKDAHGGVTHTNATTTLAAVNDNPDVSPLTDSVKEGERNHHSLDLLLGATDKEGDSLSINQLSYSVDGSPSTTLLPAGLSLAADGHSIIVDATDSAYEHLQNGQSLKIVISYLVEDGHGGQSQQTADLTIQGTDDKATLVSNVIQMTETQAIDSQHNTFRGILQLIDPDSGDNTHFESSGTYLGNGFPPGSLRVQPNGSYQFTLQYANNRYADDHIASLRTGESTDIPYEIKTSDGQSLTIIVKVIGEDNKASIAVAPYSSFTNHAYEDRTSASTPTQIWSGGNLHVIDPDHDQAGFVAQNISTAEGGNFFINSRGDWAYTIDNAKVQHLGQGESYQKTFTVDSIDGSAHQDITVTVHGTNDAPIITSAISLAAGIEDTEIHITQAQLLANASDVDDNDLQQLHVDSISVDHGAITKNSDGSFTFKPTANYTGAVHFSYDVKDAHSGVTHTSASTTLAEVQDKAIVSGDITGDVIEENDIITGNHIEVTGHVFVADPDAGQQGFQYRRTTSVDDPFGGTLHISSGGTWTYDVDNTKLQHLAANEEVLVTHRVYTLDGTAQDIVIKVTGTNDKPVVTEVQQGPHNITEDGGNSTSGQITISDVDHSDQHSVTVEPNHQPQYGSVSYNSTTQTWIYALNNNDSNVDTLNDGDQLTDKFSLLVDDSHGGTTVQEVQMTINGHSDAPPMPTLVAPARITGGAGHQDLHASIGTPPIVQGTATSLTGWGISDNHGHSLSSLHGQYGTLHINPATGELNYDYQSSSSVIKSHTSGSYGSGSDQTDSFLLTLGGNQNSQVAVHLHLHSQSVHGNSGHHIDQTTLTGMDISPITLMPALTPKVSDMNDDPEAVSIIEDVQEISVTDINSVDDNDIFSASQDLLSIKPVDHYLQMLGISNEETSKFDIPSSEIESAFIGGNHSENSDPLVDSMTVDVFENPLADEEQQGVQAENVLLDNANDTSHLDNLNIDDDDDLNQALNDMHSQF
ncbi:hypothetical protein CXF85_11260 [Colwellia sp. 75C3]|uniref:VCBS domain-containing protein n=1 Tax=Colwellia sp. 75C3 TaxID=888425 RepID=UPI000C32F94E|nr:VCBS domain-containing protein [Colwellia sp. 75C3]PKG83300.1 hypothetical protein CXF85_11260 [Colwellia sp. 75C3]